MSIKENTDKILHKNSARFCMPGHKGKLSFYDITEIKGADNLADPKEEIKRSQRNIAEVYKSNYSYISVNGSTGAILAAILATCQNSEIIIDRQCHISAINGITLARAIPHYIYPKQHDFFGVSCGITPQQVEDSILKFPNSKAIFITSPTYYGVCSNIKEICEIAHKNNMVVIVDAAHGAHFAFSDNLPMCSVSAGADIVINSTHKTLNCLTQGALAHISGNLVNHDTYKKYLNMVQTTSPSYLLMSSIEQSVYDAQQCNYDKIIEICEEIRQKSKLPTLCDGGFDYDKTRLVFNGENIDLLFSKQDIIIEMYDGANAVLIPTPYNSKTDFKRLLDFVSNCDAAAAPHSGEIPITKAVMSPYEVQNFPQISIGKNEAVGKICASTIYKLPPCMPILCPGEVVTEEIIQYVDHEIMCINN